MYIPVSSKMTGEAIFFASLIPSWQYFSLRTNLPCKSNQHAVTFSQNKSAVQIYRAEPGRINQGFFYRWVPRGIPPLPPLPLGYGNGTQRYNPPPNSNLNLNSKK
jgi:hypothetical protein